MNGDRYPNMSDFTVGTEGVKKLLHLKSSTPQGKASGPDNMQINS
jgi:hypothetical protein